MTQMWNTSPHGTLLLGVSVVGLVSTLLFFMGINVALYPFVYAVKLVWFPLLLVGLGLWKDQKRWLSLVSGALFYGWVYGTLFVFKHFVVLESNG